ncbi:MULTISPECIES: antibiotic biosynthesis monooxygenase family protein [Gordonia]|uniref:antibiotic biosynthesis monooxygenase family protein n=1 Tax=Gordonia TaxID=2053 RepID=UPI00199F1999|nr:MULTISPECIES: antibiotic biosynthesis monooxygenase [Gordonia]MBD0022517.1 antibiotic biosynthesis monooxygenase [Gordonia sp. (in: high G+C Gram-positive bacteria)]
MSIASTPDPPYTAVIFTSIRTDGDNGYAAASEAMDRLAAQQPGYLGVESAREDVGITVSYWASPEAAHAWKRVVDHRVVQKRGREEWYAQYQVRIATVEREYGYSADRSDSARRTTLTLAEQVLP